MIQEIYIIDDDKYSLQDLKQLFVDNDEYKFVNVSTEEINKALMNIPSLIIINEDNVDRDEEELCATIRKNEDNSITPPIWPTKQSLFCNLCTFLTIVLAVNFIISSPLIKP